MKQYDKTTEPFEVMTPDAVVKAYERVAPFAHRTPLVTSQLLNQWLGHEVVFKAECLQKIGAFKLRGAVNKVLTLKEQGKLPARVVAFSAGNHAQALAWAAREFGIEATIVLPKIASAIKKQATEAYGAKVVVTQTRQEAEDKTEALAAEGAVHVPAYDDDAIIAGQGTACYEALQDMEEKPDAIFSSVGGGGLLSGSFLAKALLSPQTKLFGVEPVAANDASRSWREGTLYRFDDSPKTIADGVRTLSLSPRTFHYAQQADGFYEVAEEDIIYWTQWLMHLLKLTVEPTAALAMAGAVQWLKQQTSKQRVMVVLSGGNVSPDVLQQIWSKDYLTGTNNEIKKVA